MLTPDQRKLLLDEIIIPCAPAVPRIIRLNEVIQAKSTKWTTGSREVGRMTMGDTGFPKCLIAMPDDLFEAALHEMSKLKGSPAGSCRWTWTFTVGYPNRLTIDIQGLDGFWFSVILWSTRIKLDYKKRRWLGGYKIKVKRTKIEGEMVYP